MRINVERVDAEPGFATLRFAIQDTGIGMSEGQVKCLFQSFAQADGSITRRFGGAGLGLAISQRLVGLMGGEIIVTSTLGQGSEFSFNIRLAIPEEISVSHTIALQPLVREPSVAIRGARILLVEDNEINQQVAGEILERWGFSIVVASDGEQALTALEESRPFDLVLMDVQMPVMDGLEAARRIRRNERFRDLPVIAMTAAVLARDQAECFEFGMNDHIAKPILPGQLLVVLERWIVSGERGAPIREANELQFGTDTLPDQLSGFDIDLALQRLNGNRVLLMTLLKRFGEKFSRTSDIIADLVGRGQYKEAMQWVHKLKGAAGNLSATEVYHHAGLLEQELKNDLLPISQAAFDQTLSVVLTSIATLSPSAKPCTSCDWSRATVLLKEIRTLLDNGEFVPLDFVSELQKVLPSLSLRDDLVRLKEQIDTLDYSTAANTMDRLTLTIQPLF
ncbi:hypothetical protein CCP3SC1_2150001 [Gammaproteobacteria bacterium]